MTSRVVMRQGKRGGPWGGQQDKGRARNRYPHRPTPQPHPQAEGWPSGVSGADLNAEGAVEA
eukprot:CAMPEP_0181245932 /NCGR_PEP_ID=MMETSP1096-20121128/43723_1 /TAXON_ID=156174 ORGANISM="Chrysochromulina ericina, Strain CCMP281" /NCGR_SAMPLE_ID=MMETSP1096 /ASSEMBLY_ACC=CAM_ASM_000453 /LENGTH=61 /DNA_ID=CAMNT_0023342713 /DNA_START=42 /DNA_END=224 /DNA_ORIENTATION=+